MRLDMHFKSSLWLLCKEDKRGPRGQAEVQLDYFLVQTRRVTAGETQT